MDEKTKFLTIAEAARTIGVGRQVVDMWVRKKVNPLPLYRLDGARYPRIKLSELIEYANSVAYQMN